MKSRILMATAAVGLVISGMAMAANNPATPAAAANSNAMQPAAMAPMATTTTTTTTTAAPNAMMQAQSGKTVLDLADSNPNFSTLASAIKAAGLEQTLSAKGPLTVFAPTNAAFAKLGPAKLNELMNPANKAELTQILTYHVVPQPLPSQPTAQSTSLTTAEGQSLSLTKETVGYQVQNAKSLGNAMPASNGSIIAIDSVLMPEAAAKMGTTAPAASNANPNAALPSVAGTTTVKTITPASTTSVTTTTVAPVTSAMTPAAPASNAMTK